MKKTENLRLGKTGGRKDDGAADRRRLRMLPGRVNDDGGQFDETQNEQ
jgi:hypothetical protein